MPDAELSFVADVPSPFVDYAADLIARTTGLRLVVAPRDSGGSVDVYYGEDTARPCLLRIPRIAGYTLETVPRLPDATRAGAAVASAGEFPFDLFTALRFWLADEGHVHAPVEAYDKHDRLWAEASAQEALGVREVPIVNAYLLQFRAWATLRTGAAGASPLPPGKRCILVLSHDVDSPIDPGSPRHAVELALANVRRGRKPARSIAYAAGTVGYAVRFRLRDPDARHQLFEHVMDEEERRGFRSTFFFAAVSRFDRNGDRRDVGYDVGRSPLPECIRAVASRGFGVGLHIGYRARAQAARIAAERERLEAVAGTQVTGSRHHYWHMTRPFWASLEAHGRAGLLFDSSVGFNSAPGYRLGVALPFHPWNPETGSVVPTLQIPTLAMDSMLMLPRAASVEAVIERFEGVLAPLKRYEGVAALDWHEYTSFPGSTRYRAWGEAYLSLLDHLAGDGTVLVQTYDELVAAVATQASHASAGPGRGPSRLG